IEKQVMQLHQANVLLYMKEIASAQALIEGVTEEVLLSQKARLEERIARIESGEEDAEAAHVAGTETPAEPEEVVEPEPAWPVFAAEPVRMSGMASLLGASVGQSAVGAPEPRLDVRGGPMAV